MKTPRTHTGPISGSCVCGQVKLTIQGLDREVIYCHCSQCRKQSGHFVAATRARDEDLQLEGSESLRWYSASESARRGFCSNCGSILMWKANDSNVTSIMAGCLEDAEALQASSHIYVEEKGNYYDIEDGLPEHPQSD